jgi:hypothetical protein
MWKKHTIGIKNILDILDRTRESFLEKVCNWVFFKIHTLKFRKIKWMTMEKHEVHF